MARIITAAVWLQQGLVTKVLDGDPRQRAIVAAAVGDQHARAVTVGLAVGEMALAAWTLTGRCPRANALTQTVAIVGVKAGGWLVTGSLVPDRRRALTSGAGVVALAWLANREAAA